MQDAKDHQSDAAGMGRQARKSAETRRRVCDSAVQLLATSGYHRTSIAAVAKASNVSIGALQHHFPTKLDLIAAVAGFLLNRSIEFIRKVTLKADAGDFEDALMASWSEQFQTSDYEALLQLMVAARTEIDLKERLTPELNRWRAVLESELASHIEGSAASESVLNRVTISRALMTGLLVHDDLTGDETSIKLTLEEWAKISRID
ncbi:MAG: TetR/AcrR family transcriptional regulator [Pseudomonadota bacterium]